jgi:septal ring factor EnvC (AmiA/AmiB activator)
MIFRKIQSTVLALASFALIAGCAASGTNRQSDLDALNAKISALQSELADKDNEMARLSNQMKEEESARRQAENERKSLADRLAQLEAKKASARPDSDLK